MNVYIINSDTRTEISHIITNITLKGEYRSCCRTLDFGIISSQTDKRISTVDLNLGDNIQVVENGEVLFHGIIWTRDKATNSNEINIHCKDFGIYLIKNRHSYKFKNITPENITKKIASDFNLELGEIASTGKIINRNYLGATLYSIIMSSYTLANDKVYMCMFKGYKLNVIEKGIIACTPIESSVNLLTSSVSETLNNMTNRVNIYNEDDNLIKTVENTDHIKLYGLLSDYIKAYDNKENYTLKAEKKIKGVEQKITVTNFGDIQYTTGKSVVVTEPYTGLKGKFYIDADEHNWKNGIYTNKLTLNFKNLMDEKESGSDG